MIWIPVLLTAALILFVTHRSYCATRGDLGALMLAAILVLAGTAGLPVIWLAYFSTLYFVQ